MVLVNNQMAPDVTILQPQDGRSGDLVDKLETNLKGQIVMRWIVVEENSYGFLEF